MAELIHTTYRDTDGTIRRTRSWTINIWHASDCNCDCKRRDGSAWRGVRNRYRVTTRTDNLDEAKRALEAHKKSIARDEPQSRDGAKLTFAALAALLVTHYENKGRRLPTLHARFGNLLPVFGHRRAIELRPSDIDNYVAARRKAGAAPATINRELEVLARALVLGRREGLFTTLRVRDHRLEQAPPRSGFFERDAFASVMRALTRTVVRYGKRIRLPADDLRLACAIAHELGWRMQSEILTLPRKNVDLANGTLRLDAGTTKNKAGRVAYMTPALREAVRAQLQRIDEWQRHAKRVTPWLFTHLEGRHAGQRIRDFVRSWRSACRRAGQPGMLRHDLRRTAVRGLMNVGVPERVAMEITGHKTNAVFRRYHIVAPADLQRAARLLAQGDAQAPTTQAVALGPRIVESAQPQ